MPFTSYDFAIFFAIVLALNWWFKNNYKYKIYQPFLLAANLVFYAFSAPQFIPLLLAVSLSNFFTAKILYLEDRKFYRKLYLTLNVSFCLFVLGFFKYFEFFITTFEQLGLVFTSFQMPQILYPVGLSFFTFQGLSLAIDHYRNKDLKPPTILEALVFVSFFPTILSGPIQRAGNFIPQLYNRNKLEFKNFNLAVVLILSGLFKKITLSSYLSDEIVRGVFQVPQSYSALGVWGGIYGYSAQIYLDFSGYSDLAIGIALLLGYNVGINFNSPYMARSIIEFWHRWHISLSTWLRDYLYFSLGGNRKGNKNLNLFLTQTLGGLWHGANLSYVIWGVGHGLALILNHLWRAKVSLNNNKFIKLKSFLGFFITFNFVSLMWILFKTENAMFSWEIVKAAFNFKNEGANAPIMAWGIIILTLLMQIWGLKVKNLMLKLQEKMNFYLLAVWCAFWIIIILKLGPDGVLPFIYFQY